MIRQRHLNNSLQVFRLADEDKPYQSESIKMEILN